MSKAQLQRKAIVEKLKTDLIQCNNMFVLSNNGMTVKQFNSFRKSMREIGVKCIVSKNTLMKKALKDSLHKDIQSYLHGPSVFLISNTDEAEVSKKVTSFVDNASEKMGILAASLSGSVVKQGDIIELSKLPSMNEVRGSILNIISSSSIRLLRLLNTPAQQLLYLISKKGE